MNHSFDVDLAVKYGLQEAIFLENLRFWILKNKANKRHFYEGRYWTYNSAQAYAALFPYWSKQQVERIIAKLKEQGVIQIGHFSSNTYDRTNWYSINDELLSSKSMNGGIQFDESTNTDINQIKTTRKRTTDNPLFDLFWNAYPRKTNKGFAKQIFQKLSVDQVLLDKMLLAIGQQKQSDQWKNPQYIPHPSTWLNGERWEDELNTTAKPLSPAEREKQRLFRG